MFGIEKFKLRMEGIVKDIRVDFYKMKTQVGKVISDGDHWFARFDSKIGTLEGRTTRLESIKFVECEVCGCLLKEESAEKVETNKKNGKDVLSSTQIGYAVYCGVNHNEFNDCLYPPQYLYYCKIHKQAQNVTPPEVINELYK